MGESYCVLNIFVIFFGLIQERHYVCIKYCNWDGRGGEREREVIMYVCVLKKTVLLKLCLTAYSVCSIHRYDCQLMILLLKCWICISVRYWRAIGANNVCQNQKLRQPSFKLSFWFPGSQFPIFPIPSSNTRPTTAYGYGTELNGLNTRHKARVTNQFQPECPYFYPYYALLQTSLPTANCPGCFAPPPDPPPWCWCWWLDGIGRWSVLILIL